MSQKDAWFLGLLALAYMYVDSSSAAPAVSDEEPLPAPAPPVAEPAAVALSRRFLPVRIVPRAVCPRDQLHPVAHRADGAIWCRGCDEGFYPLGVIADVLMPPVTV